METTTLNALKQSIEHWRNNVENPHEASHTWKNCALCRLFIQDACIGCPVKEKTGFSRCVRTPYYDALEAHDLELFENTDALDYYVNAAQAELDFLVSLLPEGEQ